MVAVACRALLRRPLVSARARAFCAARWRHTHTHMHMHVSTHADGVCAALSRCRCGDNIRCVLPAAVGKFEPVLAELRDVESRLDKCCSGAATALVAAMLSRAFARVAALFAKARSAFLSRGRSGSCARAA